MLAEADMGLTRNAIEGVNNRFIGDENLLVRFYMHPRQDLEATAREGRPIWREAVYVTIMQPGNKDSIVTRPAREMDKQRFAKQFASFRQGEEQMPEGTPLSEWPGVSRSQIEELKFFNVHTVEQLANLSDSNAQNIMGYSLLREAASAYLEAAETNAFANEIAKERRENARRFEQMEAQMATLTARLAEYENEEVEE